MSALVGDVGVWRHKDFEVCRACNRAAHPGKPCEPKEPQK